MMAKGREPGGAQQGAGQAAWIQGGRQQQQAVMWEALIPPRLC